MPLVDENDQPIDMMQPWSLQSENAQKRTLELLDQHRDELEDEWGGTFSVKLLWAGRVLCELKDQAPFVAYLTDESRDARVIVDDLTFEIWDEWLTPPNPPAVKPKNLEDL